MSDEQTEIRDAARRALGSAFSRDDLKAADAVSREVLDRLWSTAAEAGWTALLVPEDAGGVGLGMQEGIVVAEELGRALAPGPWAEALAFAPCLALGEERLGALALGEMRPALALVQTDGEIAESLVDHAAQATHFLLLTRMDGLSGELSLSIVPADQAEITEQHQPLDPGTPVSRMVFPQPGEALPVKDRRALEAMRLFHAAELVGIAGGAQQLSVEYATTRAQFGVPIGSFQAIKHRLADVAIAISAADLAVRYASQSWDGHAASLQMDCVCAFDLALHAAQAATAAGIQIHGAIGVSWEHDIHLYLKRTRAIGALYRHVALRTALVDLIAA